MARKFLAFVAGAAVAILLVTLLEGLGHRVYPIPDGMDYYDRAQMTEYVATAPLGALLFVITSYSIHYTKLYEMNGYLDLREVPSSELTSDQQLRIHRVTLAGEPELLPGGRRFVQQSYNFV